MKIGIAAASHYFQPLGDADTLPALDDMLAGLCREPFRRVDRFIHLALLGSARCALGVALQPDCGLYLGSGLGPMGSNIATQEQLIRERNIPRPFDFINTLGGSAGYYTARNLELSAQNVFISRRGASLQAVLNTALADLALGIMTQALVGIVEEVTQPLAAHRRRQGLPAGTAVAEGSHWLLLQASASAASVLTTKRFASFAEISDYLKSVWRPGDQLRCSGRTESSTAAALQRQFAEVSAPHPNAPFHDSLEAAWVTEFVAAGTAGNLYLASGTPDRDWTLFHFGT
ncbi:MAG: hypothetical protein KGL98_00905 [Gammaproteobacteria bacterium]|nr:hypothetical protein [Gammaproteobacteria bacterium]